MLFTLISGIVAGKANMELKVRVLRMRDPSEVTYMNMLFVDENVLQC